MAIRMSEEAADEVRRQFGEVRDLAVTASYAVAPATEDLLEACGEFADDVRDGADTHHLGYRQLLDIAATASRLVVTNVNELYLELTELDEDAALALDRRPGGPVI